MHLVLSNLLNITLNFILLISLLTVLITFLLYAIFSKKNKYINTVFLSNKHAYKEVIQKLNDNQNRLNSAQHIAKIGLIEKDYIKNSIYISDYVWEIFDVEKGSIDPKSSYISNFEFIHPDDREKYFKETVRIKDNLITEYQISYRIITTTSRIKHITSWGKVTYSESGKEMLKIAIAIQDVSLLKNAENANLISEKKFSDVFNYSPVIMAITTLNDEVFVDVNDLFLKTFSTNKNDIIGKSALELNFHPDINRRNLMFETLKNNGFIKDFELKIRILNGEIKTFSFNGTVIDLDGKNHFLAIVNDITEIKKSETALHLSEEKYRQIVENTTDGIYIYKDNKFIFYNKRLQLALGYSAEEMETINIWKLIHPDDLETIKGITYYTTQKQQIRSVYEARAITKNGDIRICEFTAKKIVFNEENAILGIVRDITELRKIENDLKEINKNLELKVNEEFKKREKHESALIQKSKLEFLGEMAAGMSHEINQPLTGISLGIENIINKINSNHFDKEYFNQKFTNIFHYIKRIQNIIEHVRTFSRDQQYAVSELFSINNIIINTLTLIEKPYNDNNITVEINFNNTDYLIKGNQFKLEQVILNLLTNSKDAIIEKWKKSNIPFDKKINIVVNEDDTMIYITIKDNGIGIEKNKIDNIFDPFYTSKEANKGTGLGLSIVYGIIKEFRGEIQTESLINEYTIMKIILPKSK